MIYTVVGLGLVLCGLALAGILGVLAVRPPRAPSADEDAEIRALERQGLFAWRARMRAREAAYDRYRLYAVPREAPLEAPLDPE